MTTAILKRQFITDATGDLVGVILPMEEFALIEKLLEQHAPAPQVDKLALMEQAANDLLFMADLRETMSAFDGVDAEWWEPGQ